MGFTPQQVETMSLWQFHSAYAGWARAQGAETAQNLSDEDFDKAAAALDAAPDKVM